MRLKLIYLQPSLLDNLRFYITLDTQSELQNITQMWLMASVMVLQKLSVVSKNCCNFNKLIQHLICIFFAVAPHTYVSIMYGFLMLCVVFAASLVVFPSHYICKWGASHNGTIFSDKMGMYITLIWFHTNTSNMTVNHASLLSVAIRAGIFRNIDRISSGVTNVLYVSTMNDFLIKCEVAYLLPA